MLDTLVRCSSIDGIGLTELVNATQPLEGWVVGDFKFLPVEPYESAHGQKKFLPLLLRVFRRQSRLIPFGTGLSVNHGVAEGTVSADIES